MGLCKDPTVTQLNKLGYNMVKLPRVGIEPLDVLGRENNSMEKLGSITEVWTSSAPAPQIGAPLPAAGIEGEKSNDLDLGIGLKLLSNVLAGMGSAIGLPSLTLGFKHAKKVQFRFVNVVSVSVTPFALGKFLGSGLLDLDNPFVSHYFGNDETQEYVIFDVLKSNSLSVTAKTENGTNVDADINALQSALTANVKLKTTSTGTSEIVFESTDKVTFAFKVFEIFFENNKWVPKGTKADDELSFATTASGESSEAGDGGVVLSPGGMVRLK